MAAPKHCQQGSQPTTPLVMEESPSSDDGLAAQRSLLGDAVTGEPDDGAVLKALFRSVKQGQLSTFEALLDKFGTSTLARPAAPPERDWVVRGAYHERLSAGSKITEDIVDEYDLLEGGGAVLKRIFGDADKLEFCKALVKHGWDLNKRIGNGSTPLSCALKCPETAGWLLDHGADPNMPAGADGKVDLLAVAAAISPPQLVKQLLERGARVQETLALHAAAIASAERIDEDEWKPDPSRVEVLHMLLDAGANVNQMQPDPKGPDAWSRSQRQRTPSTGTPLHYAVTEGSPEAVSCLLARGADLSAPSWSGHTAMQAAERARRQDILHVIALHKKQWAT